jgi:hypothetical protein
MPDSLLPIPGPASRRERDLNSLLSGEAGYPTVVLGPVADVLDALRGAPAPDELSGEAAARAVFRLLMLPDAGSPGGLPWALPSAGPRHRRARHARARHGRARRQVPWPGRWQVIAVAGSAAAAVVIGAAALAGAFSGPGGQQGSAGYRATAQAAADTSSGHATSPVLEGGGSSVSAARPTHRADTPQPAAGYGTAGSPQELCRQYVNFFTHPKQSANWSAENAVIQQLSKLAGGPMRINGYCARQFQATGPGTDPNRQGGAGAPGSAPQPGPGRFAEPAMPGAGRAGAGAPFSGR